MFGETLFVCETCYLTAICAIQDRIVGLNLHVSTSSILHYKILLLFATFTNIDSWSRFGMFYRPVQLEEIMKKAQELSDDISFTASKGWLYRFPKRHSYTCRRATNVGQSLPGCAGLMAKMFFHEVEQGIKSESEYD